jgi:CRP-like cAMP-binding protein
VRELIDTEPSFLKILLRFLRFRLVAPLLESSPLFAPFSTEERRAMAKRFQFLELESGAVLIEEGKRASGLFVLLSGEAEVSRGQGESLATLRPGDVFGEMSLLTNEPAVGTVRTTKKSFALEMPAARFTETVMMNPQVLMYVSELADQRRRANEAAADETFEFR